MEKKKDMIYLDCASGISGDMFAAAMLDLGADRAALERALDSLPLEGFEVRIGRVKKSGIDCCDFDVVLDAAHENHDHDMNYLYGHESSHHHEHEAAHHHEHETPHHHEHAHHHEHRGMREVTEILDACDMTDGARNLAKRIFTILGEAEAKAHGTDLAHVHFHEVGAIDSIADIVAAAVCFDSIRPDGVVVPPIFEGSGTVRCVHGILPIPVPAVANIVAASDLQLHIDSQTRGEFVTPTGAAIAAAIATETQLPESFSIEGIGLGAGKRDYERPNYLRAMRITVTERTARPCAGTVWKLETDIDDCAGEVLGYVTERLMESGALDAHYLPVYMKKNRPAWQLQVICDEEKRETLESIIFTETTTIGIRRVQMERTTLARRQIEVEIPEGTVRVKVCETPDGPRWYPEHESVRALAKESRQPYAQIRRAAETAARAAVRTETQEVAQVRCEGGQK